MPTLDRPPVLGEARRRRRGANAVEFALIALPLFTVLLGTMEYSWLLFNQIMLDSASREGARVSATTEVDPIAAGEAAATAYWSDLGLPGNPAFTGNVDDATGVRLIRMDGVMVYNKLMGLAPVPGSLAARVAVRSEFQP